MPTLTIKIRVIGATAATVTPSDADLQYAGERQKARIVDRTQRGLDVNGRPFEPYSTRGPYYWYPAGTMRSTKSRARSAKRMQKLIGGTLTRSGIGIKFESYAAYKRSLGRTTVDLMGPSAPHMLQSIIVWVEAGRIRLGFWDEKKAKIAAGHNAGIPGRLPKREFFGVSEDDKAAIRKDVLDSMRRTRR